jgi:hypothetical protein
MTYVEAQTALTALAHDLNLSGVEGRSVSALLQSIVVDGAVITDHSVGSDWDLLVTAALDIDAPIS